MDITARSFDAPVHSDQHIALRDSAWMGGHYVEGRYLLGMLVGENLFEKSNDEYLRRLHDFIAASAKPCFV